MISLIEQFRQRKAEQTARNIDPWLATLSNVHGQIDNKGVEQISTQLLLDILEVPQHERAKNYRRLARLMAGLGWTAQRMIGPTRGAYLDQVRGYSRLARDARQEQRQPMFPDQGTVGCGQ
jgi:hypothetical protein